MPQDRQFLYTCESLINPCVSKNSTILSLIIASKILHIWLVSFTLTARLEYRSYICLFPILRYLRKQTILRDGPTVTILYEEWWQEERERDENVSEHCFTRSWSFVRRQARRFIRRDIVWRAVVTSWFAVWRWRRVAISASINHYTPLHARLDTRRQRAPCCLENRPTNNVVLFSVLRLRYDTIFKYLTCNQNTDG